MAEHMMMTDTRGIIGGLFGGAMLAHATRLKTWAQRAALHAGLVTADDAGVARGAMETTGADGLRKRLAAGLTRINMLAGRVAAQAAKSESVLTPYVLCGDIAIVPMHGPLYAGWDWFAWVCGATSYSDLAAAIEMAAADNRVRVILLDVDSPGGTHAGIGEVLDAVNAAKAAGRTVIAMARECMCSAAYYASLACDRIWATPSALVGSIGSVAIYDDTSALYAEAGVRVIALTDETLKLAGADGVEQTPEMVAEIAGMVRQARDEFFAAVTAARGIAPATLSEWRGAAYFGPIVAANGLVDRVVTFAAALDGLIANREQALLPVTRVRAVESDAVEPNEAPSGDVPPQDPEGDLMDIAKMTADELAKARPDLVAAIGAAAAKPAAKTPATIAELKAAFPEDAAYALDAAEKGLTLVEAKAGYADVLAARLKDVQAKAAADAQAAASKPKASSSGHAGVPFAGGGESTPTTYEQAVALVTEEVKAQDKLDHKAARNRAYSIAAKRFPALHADWLARQKPVNGKVVSEEAR